MPREPAKTDRNEEIVKLRLQGEKLEALASKYGISKSRINHILREYRLKNARSARRPSAL